MRLGRGGRLVRLGRGGKGLEGGKIRRGAGIGCSREDADGLDALARPVAVALDVRRDGEDVLRPARARAARVTPWRQLCASGRGMGGRMETDVFVSRVMTARCGDAALGCDGTARDFHWVIETEIPAEKCRGLSRT